MFVLKVIPKDQLQRAIYLMRVLHFALAIYMVKLDLIVQLEMMMAKAGKSIVQLLISVLGEDWLASAP